MGKGTPLWKALLFEYRLPWRYNHRLPWVKEEMNLFKFIFYFLFLRQLNKVKLRLIKLPNSKKEDITVIIAIKNRFDHKINNALKSIRNQIYPSNLIKIIIVDYDSDISLVSKYKQLCTFYFADYIRVENKLLWNRSHALNIGIKRSKTKYILTSDTDVIFKENYMSEAIMELNKNPYQVILSPCLDLPQIDIKELNFDKLKINSYLRNSGELGNGINLTLRYYYNKLQGYDEMYKLWGREDVDLIKRFRLMGLNIKKIKKSCYLHQWHLYQQGIKIDGYEKIINENKNYFKKNNSIVRNRNGWGEL